MEIHKNWTFTIFNPEVHVSFLGSLGLGLTIPTHPGDAPGLLRARGLRETRHFSNAAEAKSHGGPEGEIRLWRILG